MLMYPMFTDLLETGKQVTPFGTETYVPITLYLLYQRGTLAREEVRVFRDWIIQEVAADKRLQGLHRWSVIALGAKPNQLLEGCSFS